MKITGKNIKSYATAQVHFPREREGSLMTKSPNLSFKNMIRLNHTYYSLLKFSQAKLLKNLVFRAKFKQIKQNPLNSLIYSANCAKFAPIINLFVLCFRHLPRQRTLWNSSELRKFRAIRPHSPRITQNSHRLLTYLYYVSGTCPGRERSGIPVNYTNSAQFTHTVHELREICTFC